MARIWHATILASMLLGPGAAYSGVHYSGEQFAELPSQWRGFLIDQRQLRAIAFPPTPNSPASPLRDKYLEALAKLEKKKTEGTLTPDETADLGAVYLRLGRAGQAVDLLREAQRRLPNHYRIVANLGAGWHALGELGLAEAALRDAVRLAPGKLQRAEELHLKLVQSRAKQPRDSQALDDLFGAFRPDTLEKYTPGRFSAADAKKLPSDATASLQLLALWLPADGRLLWQLAELANAQGDVRTAAAMLDGCVTEFAMSHSTLRQHRQSLREAVDAQANSAEPGKATHEGHAGVFRPRSKRPLLSTLDPGALPPVQVDGVNALPWTVLGDTTLEKNFHPRFPAYLKDLDGKQVTLNGFMQPFGEGLEARSFMLVEYPVGCWYCEMPEIQGILFVELPKDKSTAVTRGLIKVTGKLKLNNTDPENFMYSVENAKVGQVD